MAERVLLIDDDPDVLALLKSRLENHLGCEVTTSTHPAGVVALVREHRPDLIICDIDMDERSGGGVAEDLAADEIGREIPLVFLSAHVPESAVDQNGMVDGVWMLSKSSSHEFIIDRVRAILSETRGG